MKRIQRFSQFLQKIETWVSGIFLAALTITCTLQVLTRFILHIPMPWLEEASRFSLIWMAFSGAPALTAQRKNISIDMLPGVLKNKFHFNTDIIIDIIVGLCWVCFGFYSLRLITKAIASRQVSVMMNIPFSVVYSILLIAAVLGVFHILCGILPVPADKKEE